ncbi:MAG: hypothetical protein GZ093_19675 [Rhodoferax sp.]|uniref:hypothetical protein n=1 Tax=Rhodoferax sp. TaxID=50421 RepID=UPI0013FE7FCD|nr:hypothetical protein [Rhodoferax sp.]NDP40915.1 hypothetical protein [Rhodoferax sp.]
MKPFRVAQQGFAAIAAVFLVVVLAAFGAFMVSFSNTQQLNSARDVQGSRAYWAARAGLEWAIASLPAGATACWATPPPAAVDGFGLAISCTASSFTEGAATVYIFQITAVASSGAVGSVGFVERSVSASLE